MSATDAVLKHAYYNVVTAVCVLVALMLTSSRLIVAAMVVTIISYFWGSLVAWRVSTYVYAKYSHDFMQRQNAVYAAWFASWVGAFVLLVWLHELERTANGIKLSDSP